MVGVDADSTITGMHLGTGVVVAVTTELVSGKEWGLEVSRELQPRVCGRDVLAQLRRGHRLHGKQRHQRSRLVPALLIAPLLKMKSTTGNGGDEARTLIEDGLDRVWGPHLPLAIKILLDLQI